MYLRCKECQLVVSDEVSIRLHNEEVCEKFMVSVETEEELDESVSVVDLHDIVTGRSRP